MINPCSFCTATCCKDYLITVTSFDVLRIIKKTGKELHEIAALYPATILNPDNETMLECYDGRYRDEYLLALRSYPCYFLDDKNRCTIYEIAPFTCRKYPIARDKQVIKRAACPIPANILFRLCGTGITTNEFDNQIIAYKKIVVKWNQKHGKTEDCLSFLIKESKKEK